MRELKAVSRRPRSPRASPVRGSHLASLPSTCSRCTLRSLISFEMRAARLVDAKDRVTAAVPTGSVPKGAGIDAEPR